jgi:rubrerythrin
MSFPIRQYDEEEIKKCIQAIADGREQDITLPIRMLRKTMPKEFSKAIAKGRRNTDEMREVSAVYNKKYYKLHPGLNNKNANAYGKALSELKKKHNLEFKEILKNIKERIIK